MDASTFLLLHGQATGGGPDNPWWAAVMLVAAIGVTLYAWRIG